MLKNYINIAIRSLTRQKVHSLINIVGLSLGLSACIIIAIFVRHQLSYESMHENRDRIFRVNSHMVNAERNEVIAVTPARVPVRSRADYPQLEAVTQVFDFSQGRRYLTRVNENSFYETDLFFADEYFFQIFEFDFILGNPKTALKGPNKVVLTEEMAQKYFGKVDVLGKNLEVSNGEYEVTGVIENIPGNTVMRFDFLYSLETLGRGAQDRGWFPMNFITYVLAKPNADPEPYINGLNNALQEDFGETLEAQGLDLSYELQPFSQIHYNTSIGSDYNDVINPSMIYAFTLIAAFILLIACINYINLSTAKSEKRAREVGLRKVLGAVKKQLVLQFYGETLFVTLISVVLSIVITEMLLPAFNQLSGMSLDVNYFEDPMVLVALVILTLLVSLVAGSYPAVFLSRFQPVKVLKGTFQGGKGGNLFRRVLVVIQFSVSVFLIIGTLTIYYQMNFIQNRDLGYETDAVVMITLSDGTMRRQYQTLKESFTTIPGVREVSASNQQITNVVAGWGGHGEGMAPEATISFRGMAVNEDFLETMGMNLSLGQGYADISDAADKYYYILNKAGLEAIGMEESTAIGKGFRLYNGMEGTIVGVVDNFHYASLHKEIEPFAFYLRPAESRNFMYVKVDGNGLTAALSQVESKWAELLPERPFEYGFLNGEVAKMYDKEKRTANVLIAFTCFSVFIGCLGLFGLASFMAEKRTKEIGIRKALGADTSRIVSLLSKDYLRVILISNLIAWPLGYIIMNNWLDSFSYRINIAWYIFLLAGSITVLVALVTVSYQSLKAALSNPIKALRYE